MDKTAENATHYLLCTHSLNRVSKIRYHQPCHILKTMDDGRKKILVFGDRHKGGFDKSRIRYVCRSRICRRPTHNGAGDEGEE